VSKDLVHWEELPIALYPDSLGYIFSGSAVVDKENTSGFGTKENPPVVAIFTYHNADREREKHDDFQTQGIAYSLDKGRTWKKYEKNPVVPNPQIRDFRDPKVSWNEKAKQWVMTLAVKDHIEFYGSPNLKQWTRLGAFGQKEGDHGGVWECPDLFVLKDEKGKSKYVLLVSINPGAPNGGSGTQYFIGDFDGKKFTNDTPGTNSGWIDYGTDNYAAVTFNNISKEDNRRILMGWMTNWFYAQQMPMERWRGANTLPRVLSLKTIDGKTKLASIPVNEVSQLETGSKTLNPFSGDTLNVTKGAGLAIKTSMLKGKIKASEFVMEVSNAKSQKVSIGFDPEKKEFYVDRSESGNVSFHPDFKKVIRAPRIASDEWIEFTAVFDVSSAELFFDNGATVLTVIFFPDEEYDALKIHSRSGTIQTDSISVSQLKGIWK
jgi:fructan beta-fructosidase